MSMHFRDEDNETYAPKPKQSLVYYLGSILYKLGKTLAFKGLDIMHKYDKNKFTTYCSYCKNNDSVIVNNINSFSICGKCEIRIEEEKPR